MGRTSTLLTSAIVTLALAWPVAAAAQATRRGGGGSSSAGSTSGSSTRSGSSGGGSAAPRVAVPRAAPSRPSPPPSRPSSASGGGSSASRPSRPQAVGGTYRARTGSAGSASAAAGTTRTRGARAAEGYAQARTGGSYDDPFGPWGLRLPRYSWGLGSHYGYLAYDPWRYGLSRWTWSTYGGWYDPFGYPYGYGGYGSYGYAPYGYGGYWGSSYAVGGRDDRDDDAVGSLRLRIDPKEAAVYIDGALAGTVDDFDGLGNHLELEAGPHQLEVRAEGYEPYTTQVTVEPGRTSTERASLKLLD